MDLGPGFLVVILLGVGLVSAVESSSEGDSPALVSNKGLHSQGQRLSMWVMGSRSVSDRISPYLGMHVL
jgi:hypothetical protein